MSPRLLLTLLAGGLAAAAAACDRAADAGDSPPPSPPSSAEPGLVILADPDAPPPLPGDPPPRPGYHDFGSVPDGETVEHDFLVRNDAAGPVDILKIQPSCGCTVLSMAYEDQVGETVRSRRADPGEPMLTLPPGVTARLRVRIDTESIREKNVDKLNSVVVTTDAEGSLYLRFEVHIVVESPFQVVPQSAELGSIARSAGGRGKVEIVPVVTPPAGIGGVLETTGGVRAEIERRERPAGTFWVLTAGFDPPLAPGYHEGEVVVAVERGGEELRPLRVRVRANAVEDVQASPARLVIVADRSSEEPFESSVEVFSLLPGHRLLLTDAAVKPGHENIFEASVEPESPDAAGRGERWLVRLRTRGALEEGVVHGSLRVKLDDPQTPEIAIPYVLHAR